MIDAPWPHFKVVWVRTRPPNRTLKHSNSTGRGTSFHTTLICTPNPHLGPKVAHGVKGKIAPVEPVVTCTHTPHASGGHSHGNQRSPEHGEEATQREEWSEASTMTHRGTCGSEDWRQSHR